MIQRLVSALAALVLLTGGATFAYHTEAAWTSSRARQSAAPAQRATEPTGTPTTTHDRRGSPTPRATATTTAEPTRTPTARPTAKATHTPAPTPTLAPTSGTVQLGDAQFSLFTFNPWFTNQQVSFTLSAPARVSVRIAQQGDTKHVRTMDLGTRPAGTVQINWDGLDNAHRRVPEGSYTYTITATNAKGQKQTGSYNGLGVTYKRIVISLSKQQLWAFDGFHYVLSTLVTTGNPALPTPEGNFSILAMYSPFTFHSPWPVGSQYYYAPSYTNYAMLFDNAGYYVHDAPWRSAYGPGTNETLGTPGQNYTGTHGCVNVPYVTMKQLYSWSTVGTEVQVIK